MTEERFNETASDVIAASVRERRKRLGWNAAALAERCAEAGAPELSAAVVQNIEHGRPKDGKRTRFVTVEELLGLARALSVSPAVLLPELAELPPGFPDLSGPLEGLHDLFDRLYEVQENLDAEVQRRVDEEIKRRVELDKDRGEDSIFIDPLKSPFYRGGDDEPR